MLVQVTLEFSWSDSVDYKVTAASRGWGPDARGISSCFVWGRIKGRACSREA